MHIDANAFSARGNVHAIIHWFRFISPCRREKRGNWKNSTLKYQNKYIKYIPQISFEESIQYFLVFIFLESATISMVNPNTGRHGGLEDK